MGYNSILDKLVEKYPNAEGINDARNIAEAVAAINGVGGRGANAIADQIEISYTVSFDAGLGTGSIDSMTGTYITPITLPDGSDLTAPEGYEFAGWATESDATEPDVTSPYTPTEDITLYAIYTEIEAESIVDPEPANP